MSLINQVLKDIDKRQRAQSPTPVGEGIQQTGEPRSSRRVTVMLVIVVAVTTLGGGLYLARDQLKAPAASIPTPATVTQPKAAPAAASALAKEEPTAAKEPAVPARIDPAAPPPLPARESQAVDTPRKEMTAAKIAKTESPEQRAKNLYQNAQKQIQLGRLTEARNTLTESLAADPRLQPARLLLARLLLELRNPAEAQATLIKGLELLPGQQEFLMVLAHIKAQGNDLDGAIATLKRDETNARANGDYQALLAALLQRKNLHAEASQHYLIAVRLSPNNAQWLVGLGISLQAQDMTAAAVEAYERALGLGTLSPALTEIAQQRLTQLNRGVK